MSSMVVFPTIFKDALDISSDRCANEPTRQHFAAYMTRLMVAECKDGSGIS